MDLATNQVVEAAVLQAAQRVEDQLDDKLHQMSNMDDDEVERLRQTRILQIRRQREKKEAWLKRGHGEYQDLLDEKEFFASMKGEECMVCHFYRDNLPCKVMDKHLSILCKQHLECKFAKINAEKSPYLTEKLKIWMLPTLALIKNEKTVDYVVGLDDLGGRDDFATEVLAARLATCGVITYHNGDPVKDSEGRHRSVRKGGFDLKCNGDYDEGSDFD